ncbi:hypothetical protein D3C80_1336700 [compost metagenome]
MPVVPDVQPGLVGQPRWAAEEGQLGETVGALAKYGRITDVADRHRLSDQIGCQTLHRASDHLVEWAAELGDGAVQPDRHDAVHQRLQVRLAQAGGGFYGGIGDVHLHPAGAERH